ncbi:hypothetical protein N8261_04740 [Flavobacteriaceae bacterium]|nr:hypothetical protein [Flavobacteriaceae bacterium]
MSSYSVFIPRVFSNIRTNRISDVFHNLNIGDVEKVDLIAKTNPNGDSYNMAFVHFTGLYDTPEGLAFRHDVEDPETKAKLVYEDPWFWIVLPFEKKERVVPTMNPIAAPFVPQYEAPQMVQFCVMTPQGPMWQWGIPSVSLPTPVSTKQFVPPQVMYGNLNNKARKHPRKRINVPKTKVNDSPKMSIIIPPLDLEEGEVSDGDGF